MMLIATILAAATVAFEVPMPSDGDAHLAVTFSRFQKTQRNFQESQ